MRLIDADALQDEIEEWIDTVGNVTVGKGLSYYGELQGCIEECPTIDAEPVRHGRWIKGGLLPGNVPNAEKSAPTGENTVLTAAQRWMGKRWRWIRIMDKEVAEKYHTHVRYGMGYEYYDAYCPRCDSFICPEPMIREQKEHYCENCGQKIKFDE